MGRSVNFLRPLAVMRAVRLPPADVYCPLTVPRGLCVVCRARGARRPLFRRSQFHVGAALTARKALDARLWRRGVPERTNGGTVAATIKYLAERNKPVRHKTA